MTREQIIETMARAAGETIAKGYHGRRDAPSKRNALSEMAAALSALEAAGMVVVPVKPTDRMIDAAIMADRPPLRKITVGDVLKAEYTAMVKAALNPERDSSG